MACARCANAAKRCNPRCPSAKVEPDMFPGARVKFIALKVSAPFHCAMMKPAEEEMARVLATVKFSQARFPVVQNVNAEAVTNGDTLRKNLVAQVSAPVRWIE